MKNVLIITTTILLLTSCIISEDPEFKTTPGINTISLDSKEKLYIIDRSPLLVIAIDTSAYYYYFEVNVTDNFTGDNHREVTADLRIGSYFNTVGDSVWVNVASMKEFLGSALTINSIVVTHNYK